MWKVIYLFFIGKMLGKMLTETNMNPVFILGLLGGKVKISDSPPKVVSDYYTTSLWLSLFLP